MELVTTLDMALSAMLGSYCTDASALFVGSSVFNGKARMQKTRFCIWTAWLRLPANVQKYKLRVPPTLQELLH